MVIARLPPRQSGSFDTFSFSSPGKNTHPMSSKTKPPPLCFFRYQSCGCPEFQILTCVFPSDERERDGRRKAQLRGPHATMSSSPPPSPSPGGGAVDGGTAAAASSNSDAEQTQQESAAAASPPASSPTVDDAAPASPAPAAAAAASPSVAPSPARGSGDADGGGDEDERGSPQRSGSSPGAARSPVGSPLQDFSPPRSIAGSIPRTPSSIGGRSLPGTPRTPFTPMDMQVSYLEAEGIQKWSACMMVIYSYERGKSDFEFQKLSLHSGPTLLRAPSKMCCRQPHASATRCTYCCVDDIWVAIE